MPRVLALLSSVALACGTTSCISSPDFVTLDADAAARDAPVLPDRPAETVALADDGGSGPAEPDADVIAPVPPPPPGCDACPPGMRCCERKGGNKGKGKGGGDVEIVCVPASSDCDEG